MINVSSNLNLLNILSASSEYLEKHGIENSRLNAEQMLCYATNMDRIQLYLNQDRALTETELQVFKSSLNRRTTSEPLQYILGETEFFSLPFKITPDVLIPRPETELLIENVLDWLQRGRKSQTQLVILDVGTGSGCIAISLAKHIKNCRITAIDVSPKALRVAENNARLNGVSEKINFYPIDFLKLTGLSVLKENYDIIVSNPPYISRDDFNKLPVEVKDFEPEIALNDHADGYAFYRALAEFSPARLKRNGLLSMEIGMGQSPFVKQLMKKYFSEIKIVVDLNGIDRVISCEF